MTKIIPWSPSGLDTFVSCPHQFHEVRILRNFQQEQSEEQHWGEHVHKKFQERQEQRLGLPQDLQMHEPFMRRLEEISGHFKTEQWMALDTKFKPCHQFDKECFFRGICDYVKVDEDTRSGTICDYKTGKVNEKWKQLAIYAIHTFINFPFLDMIEAMFYWTQTQGVTSRVWTRIEIDTVLWPMLIPDLKQYKQAFKDDVWQKRPSGLCHGWCPVSSCEHYSPHRRRR
jgi:PD-(D/E)XK nuclease superfamily protein